MKPIDVGDIHNKHEDKFEKMLKGKLLNQKETLIKATTTGIDTKTIGSMLVTSLIALFCHQNV